MDNGKFLNSYLEITNNTAHEYLNNVLLLKAQLKSAEELISERDAQIKSLTEQILVLTQQNTLNNDMLSELEEVKKQNASLIKKTSEIDAFSRQITDMKRMIIEKDQELEKLTKKPQVKKKTTIEQPLKPTDDF